MSLSFSFFFFFLSFFSFLFVHFNSVFFYPSFACLFPLSPTSSASLLLRPFIYLFLSLSCWTFLLLHPLVILPSSSWFSSFLHKTRFLHGNGFEKVPLHYFITGTSFYNFFPTFFDSLSHTFFLLFTYFHCVILLFVFSENILFIFHITFKLNTLCSFY